MNNTTASRIEETFLLLSEVISLRYLARFTLMYFRFQYFDMANQENQLCMYILMLATHFNGEITKKYKTLYYVPIYIYIVNISLTACITLAYYWSNNRSLICVYLFIFKSLLIPKWYISNVQTNVIRLFQTN